MSVVINAVSSSVDLKLEEIHNSLRNMEIYAPGLLSGYAGKILFLTEYYNYKKTDVIFDELQECVSSWFSHISNCGQHNFSNGLSGIAWLIMYMNEKDIIGSEMEGILEDIDKFIIANIDLNSNTSDFMTGALGSALYLLKRGHKETIKIFILSLKEQAKNDNGAFWLSTIWGEEHIEKEVINLGIPHGSAGVIIFLSKLVGDSYFNECKVEELISDIILFIQNRVSGSESEYYPGTCFYTEKGSLVNDYSRLSWCYGDMGLGIAFWEAGKALNNNQLKEEAIKIYRQILKRRLPEEDKIYDACFCHGTAGIAHMYNRMYYNTGISEFKEASDYWNSETMKMSKFPDGFAGFKIWHVDTWMKDYSILNGIAGIGLCFLGAQSRDHMNWDECFLIS